MTPPAWSELVRDIPDFPEPGIVFKDLTPVLADAEAFGAAVDDLIGLAEPLGADKVVGIEARGFIFGATVARHLAKGFVPVRKPGKLPHASHREDYDLEYGTDALEAHLDALETGERVLVVDDVLATGGTAAATCRLVESLGGTVAGVVVLIELGFLGGASALGSHDLHSVLKLGD